MIVVFPGDAKDLKQVDFKQLSECKVKVLVIHNMERFEPPSDCGDNVDSFSFFKAK